MKLKRRRGGNGSSNSMQAHRYGTNHNQGTRERSSRLAAMVDLGTCNPKGKVRWRNPRTGRMKNLLVFNIVILIVLAAQICDAPIRQSEANFNWGNWYSLIRITETNAGTRTEMVRYWREVRNDAR